jgi:hypothetical protein
MALAASISNYPTLAFNTRNVNKAQYMNHIPEIGSKYFVSKVPKI